MQIIIHSQNLEVTPGIKDYIEKKLNRLARYFDHIVDAEVHTSSQRGFKTAEVTVKAPGRLIRAEERNVDIRVAIDQVSDKLEKQIKQYKERLVDRSRRPRKAHFPGAPARAAETEDVSAAPESEITETSWPQIVRRKTFAVETMTAEEAAERMLLLGHNFYLFREEGSGRLSLVYERLDGHFGVLEPDLAESNALATA